MPEMHLGEWERPEQRDRRQRSAEQQHRELLARLLAPREQPVTDATGFLGIATTRSRPRGQKEDKS